ncbi:ABC transporter substrate-binding protein [Sphingomonas sp. 1P06PA]|uniref:ABC transporter substrate-binding protein n=1 Tax=Sphingomonas sp. 1P06PA TaxID=554121 RepID=UPI0039A51138
MIRRTCLTALLLLLTACDAKIDPDEPVTVSVIGRPPAIIDPSQKPYDRPTAVLLATVAQGLVRLDGAGQVEPGLAIRWDVSDDGLFYTFRLADGLPIDAEVAARRLRAAIGPTSRNPLKPVLGAIAEVVAVTPEILEIRLSAPRPELLQLLAQPALALIGPDGGSGPLTIAERGRDLLRLTPLLPDKAEPIDEDARRRQEIVLRGEKAALAVARFRDGGGGVVTGGTFADLAIARAAGPRPRQLHFDPAVGLFGLEVVATPPFLQAAENRAALAMAIDRQRIATLFGAREWRIETALVPAGTAEIATPTQPGWLPLDLVARADRAKAQVAVWRAAAAEPPAPLRVAMPAGPGARLLFALIRQDWSRIGVEAVAVPTGARADLRLIDSVAPGDGASWWLSRFRCGDSPICSEQSDLALDAAHAAPTLEERARWLREAEARLSDLVPFIALAQPLRWSLVAPGLDGWRDNPRAAHPLIHLRENGGR